MSELSNYIGILGVFMVLVAYYLLQAGSVRPESLIFSYLNLIGAILILVSLFFHWNLASVIIEIAWIIISLKGILKYRVRA